MPSHHLRYIHLGLVILMCLTVGMSQQRKKLNIAVFDFDSRGGISKEDAASLSDIFQAQLVQTNEFTVVDRARIKTLLQEQGFQQSEACSNTECLVDIGKILKVEKMFAGTVGKVGRIYNVNIQIVDVATAQILMQKARQHSGTIEELAEEIIPEIAAEMASDLTGKKISAKVATSGGGSSWLWYVGGAVVIGGGAAAAVLLKPTNGGGGPGTTTQPLPGSPKFPGQ